MKRCFTAGLITAAAMALFAGGAAAVTLYDPGQNTLPADQQWTTAGLGSFAQSVAGGQYVLDTSAGNAVRAGSELLEPSLLNTATGFTLDFSLRIDAESHTADNERAGFSLIATGADPTHSLEIGFWQTGVFAYGSAFIPGAVTSFATTARSDYSLVVANDQYRFLGNGQTLLAGALVDYTGSGLAPYTTPGALFFGDDTTRALSVSELGAVTLVTSVPEPATVTLMAAGLFALVWRRARRSLGQSFAQSFGMGRGRPLPSIAT